MDYIYKEMEFVNHAMVDGSEILQAYKKEAFNIEKKDFEIEENFRLRTYVAQSPKL
jgi:hypothetical protein